MVAFNIEHQLTAAAEWAPVFNEPFLPHHLISFQQLHQMLHGWSLFDDHGACEAEDGSSSPPYSGNKKETCKITAPRTVRGTNSYLLIPNAQLHFRL